MASLRLPFLTFAVLAAALMPPSAVAQPRTDYYASICPQLETIVRSSVKQSMAQSPISGPAVLRLFFHDCAVRGCDASILIVNSNGDDEWRNSDNQSLKPEGFQTIMNAKAAVDSDPQCKYKVSCADILALAAREAVYQSGGPNYAVELGRYDGRLSTRDSVVLPHADFNLDQLTAYFSGLGFSQTEMIALSGDLSCSPAPSLPTWRPHHRRGGLPLLPVQDRHRPEHGLGVREPAARHLQLQHQRLHLLRRLAGDLRQRLLPEPAGRQGPPGLRPGAVLRHEVARHREQLRGQPGRLLHRLQKRNEQAREDRGRNGGERRDTPRLPLPELISFCRC